MLSLSEGPALALLVSHRTCPLLLEVSDEWKSSMLPYLPFDRRGLYFPYFFRCQLKVFLLCLTAFCRVHGLNRWEFKDIIPSFLEYIYIATGAVYRAEKEAAKCVRRRDDVSSVAVHCFSEQ